jgi:hypothetical protein
MEATLYDAKGDPVAYIADDGENSIYLWRGHAVAYVSGENIYGWNGKQLGWFVGGVLYDMDGHRVGSFGEKCPYALDAQPSKFPKYAKYAKCARYTEYARPGLSSRYSNESLKDFLKVGAVSSGIAVKP